MPAKRKNQNPSSSEKSKRVYLFAILVLTIAVFAEAVYIFYPSTVVSQVSTLTIPDISLTGFVKVDKITPSVDSTTGEGSLSLTAGCYELSAGVEPDMAQSISNGLQGVVGPRPNAHDIIRDVFQALKIQVLTVKVTDMHDSMFFSKILIRQGNTVLNFDARPSDAIAIAVRTNSPVYINQTLIRTEGKNVC